MLKKFKTLICFLFCYQATDLLALPVEQGIEQIFTENFSSLLKNKKVALLAHPASVDKAGVHLVEKAISFQYEKKFEVTALFTPEHGLRHFLDTWVEDGIDTNTNLPVFSLYRPERKFPTIEQMQRFDTLLIDLQDVGVRFYTYNTTIFLSIKACLDNNKEVVLLDRVNPLGGKWDGPILARDLQGGFYSFFSIPLVHGLTSGELMNLMFKDHPKRHLLTIIKIKGWKGDSFSQTGLKWTPSSPALLSATQVTFYSIFGALESFNLSVGRGVTNEKAFIYFGAPWIQADEVPLLVEQLNKLALPQLQFFSAEWKVSRGLYEGQWVRGFRIEQQEGEKILPFMSFYRVAQLLLSFFPESLTVGKYTHLYLGRRDVLEALERGVAYSEWKDRLDKENNAFYQQNKAWRYYLY